MRADVAHVRFVPIADISLMPATVAAAPMSPTRGMFLARHLRTPDSLKKQISNHHIQSLNGLQSIVQAGTFMTRHAADINSVGRGPASLDVEQLLFQDQIEKDAVSIDQAVEITFGSDF